MAKFGLKAIGIILKKIVYLADHKYASKSELRKYNNPRFEGGSLVFPAESSAHFEGGSLVLTE